MANVYFGGQQPVHNNTQFGRVAAGFGSNPSFGPLPGASADQDMFDPSNFPLYFQNMETPSITISSSAQLQLPDPEGITMQDLVRAYELFTLMQAGVPAHNLPAANMNMVDASPSATPLPDSGANSGASGSAPLPMRFFGASGGLPLESPEINIVGQQAFVSNLAGPFPFGAEYIQSLPVAAVMPVEPPKPAPVTQGGVPAPDVNFVPGPNMQMFDLPIQGASATPRPNSGATSGPSVSPPLPMTPRFQGSGGLPLASPQIGIVGQNNIGSGNLNFTPEGGFPFGAGVTQSLPDLNDSKFPSVLKPVPAPEPPKPAPVRVVEAKDFPFPSVLHPVPMSMMSTGSECESESPNLANGLAQAPNFPAFPHFPIPNTTGGGGLGAGIGHGPQRTPKRTRSQPVPTTSNAGESGSKRAPKLRKTVSADTVSGPKPKQDAKLRKAKSADAVLKGGSKATGSKATGAKRAKKVPQAKAQLAPAATSTSSLVAAGPSRLGQFVYASEDCYPMPIASGSGATAGPEALVQVPRVVTLPILTLPAAMGQRK